MKSVNWDDLEEARKAIVLSRDGRGEDPELWQAALEYFTGSCPSSNHGFFAVWFCQSLTDAERGQAALRAIFTNLSRPARLEEYLNGLGASLSETRFSPQRRWVALQCQLLTELATGWSQQVTEVESYGCSHNTVAHFARVFLPILHPTKRADLALACLQALATHRQPPDHGTLSSYPEELARELPDVAVPILLGILNIELPLAANLDLKPYKRKTKRLSPSGQPALQNCLNVLTTCTWHPEWADRMAADASTAWICEDDLREVIELLDTLWLKRWTRLPEEPWEAYLSRQAPLNAFFAPTRTQGG